VEAFEPGHRFVAEGRHGDAFTASEVGRALVLFGTEFRALEKTRPEFAELLETSMRSRIETGGSG
jgi:hypothetical protein